MLKDIPIKIKQSNKSFTYISDKKGYIKVDIGNKIKNSRFDISFFLDHKSLFEGEEDRKIYYYLQKFRIYQHKCCSFKSSNYI